MLTIVIENLQDKKDEVIERFFNQELIKDLYKDINVLWEDIKQYEFENHNVKFENRTICVTRKSDCVVIFKVIEI